MELRRRQVLGKYAVAILLVAVALCLKKLLVPLLTEDEPVLLFFAAVMASAAFGGMGPGLLATVVAGLADNYYFIAPYGEFELGTPQHQWRLVLFIAEGVFISIICARLKAARQRADDSAAEARGLERRILEISDAEQRRIGHDLHDGLGQHLTGISLMSQQLEQRLTSESSPHAPRAAKISTLVGKAVEWTHDLTRALSPPALENVGLAAALDELASNAENIFGIECTFEEAGELEFRDLSVADHLYRIAQEAISNAVKHGGAKKICVQLSSQRDQIRMEIADDGSGMQPKIEEQDGMGLRIMRYRAKMIGARVDVRHRGPNAGSGTIVVCEYQRSSNNQNAEP